MVKPIEGDETAGSARKRGWRSVWSEARALATASALLTPGPEALVDADSTLPVARKATREAVPCRTVRVYFIKPSKYDEQGFVLHFWKGVLPNNTLTALAALNEEYNRL